MIKNLFLLKGLSEDQKESVISHFDKPISFKKGEIIYSSNKFSDAIGFIIKGKAFAVTDNKKNIHMKSFESGSVFGAAAVFGGEKYVSKIIAETNTTILFITEHQLKEVFIEYPQTSLNYISFLSEKIRFLNSKLSVISCGSAEDTVYRYLSGVTDSENYARLPESMTLLAKMLGLGRASLYRSLDALEQSGMIMRENNKLKVIKNEKID